MSGTPMDLDHPGSAPSNGTTTSLNITRTLGGGMNPTTELTQVIDAFRPAKVCSLSQPHRTFQLAD